MNFHELGRVRNGIIAEAARISATSSKQDLVDAELAIHRLVTEALADEGVVLPCHDDTPKEP